MKGLRWLLVLVALLLVLVLLMVSLLLVGGENESW